MIEIDAGLAIDHQARDLNLIDGILDRVGPHIMRSIRRSIGLSWTLAIGTRRCAASRTRQGDPTGQLGAATARGSEQGIIFDVVIEVSEILHQIGG